MGKFLKNCCTSANAEDKRDAAFTACSANTTDIPARSSVTRLSSEYGYSATSDDLYEYWMPRIQEGLGQSSAIQTNSTASTGGYLAYGNSDAAHSSPNGKMGLLCCFSRSSSIATPTQLSANPDATTDTTSPDGSADLASVGCRADGTSHAPSTQLSSVTAAPSIVTGKDVEEECFITAL